MQPRRVKSRLGCSPCKQYHILCDRSGNPCNNCKKRGRECTGIVPIVQWQPGKAFSRSVGKQDTRKKAPRPSSPSKIQTSSTDFLVKPAICSEIVETSPSSDFNSTFQHEIPVPKVLITPFANADPRLLSMFFHGGTVEIMSAFESSRNPIKSSIYQMLQESELVLHTAQMCASMTTGNDQGDCTNFNKAITLRLLRQALMSESQLYSESVLVSILLLGMFQSYGNQMTCDTCHIRAARELLRKRYQSQMSTPSYIISTFLYWETFVSFLYDDDDLIDEQLMAGRLGGAAELRSDLESRCEPLVGFSGGLFRILGYSGRYVRKAHSLGYQDEMEAYSLESALLSWQLPNHLVILAGTADIHEILTTAELYRYTGLATLYQVAPFLLEATSTESKVYLASLGQKMCQMLQSIAVEKPAWTVLFFPTLIAASILPPESWSQFSILVDAIASVSQFRGSIWVQRFISLIIAARRGNSATGAVTWLAGLDSTGWDMLLG
ncbi:fungal-specific transcription factor domain-containing protein [Rhexocercosporidium sp. MPI-PUGE-AT-0058]|nr:fungal-specific transcription factor domain-containing protein [Rhexocercosporidium sp. MPI-PUGE-AT-0058]